MPNEIRGRFKNVGPGPGHPRKMLTDRIDTLAEDGNRLIAMVLVSEIAGLRERVGSLARQEDRTVWQYTKILQKQLMDKKDSVPNEVWEQLDKIISTCEFKCKIKYCEGTTFLSRAMIN